jgi:hypothetical protein
MTDRCSEGFRLWEARRQAHDTTTFAALCQKWHDHRAKCKQCAKWREEDGAKWGRIAKAAPLLDWDLQEAK